MNCTEYVKGVFFQTKTFNLCWKKQKKALSLLQQFPPRFPLNSVPRWDFVFYRYMKYDKLPIDLPQQLEILKQRGLNIPNEDLAMEQLSSISYKTYMTTEKVIQYDGKVDLFNLQQVHFSEANRTSCSTDMEISKCLIDKNGTIVLLIEAITMDLNLKDGTNITKGCYIKRFEFTEDLIDTQPWIDFMESFITSVRYKMVLVNNERFKAYYSYIWSQKGNKERCIIAEFLGLKEILNENGIITYKSPLHN